MKARQEVNPAGPVEVDFERDRDAPLLFGLCFMQASGLSVSVRFCADYICLVLPSRPGFGFRIFNARYVRVVSLYLDRLSLTAAIGTVFSLAACAGHLDIPFRPMKRRNTLWEEKKHQDP